MSKSIKLSGTFRTVGVTPTPTPTHDRPAGALAAGPGSSWSLDRYEVWTEVAGDVGETSWTLQGSRPTFEEAAEACAFFSRPRIVRSTGTCEVVA